MSVVERQFSCAACGAEMTGDVEFEVLIDDAVRYVAVCLGHSTRVARAVAEADATGWEALPRAA